MIHPKHWQAILGDFEFAPPDLSFRGAVETSEDNQKQFLSWGLAMSNLRFDGGQIVAKVSYSDLPSVPTVQIVTSWNAADGSYLAVGLHGTLPGQPTWGRFAVQANDARPGGTGLQTVAQTAYVERPRTGEMTFRVNQVGSLLDLYADDVHVLRYLVNIGTLRSQCGMVVNAGGTVSVTEFAVQTRRRTAFVIMQFSPPFENLFKEVIKPVADACDVDAEKADDVAGPGIVVADLTRQIEEADLVIADITPANQNVFYEVGYAHAIGKPTILLAEKGKTLPFDVSGFRVLFYENSIAGKSQIEQGLKRHIEAINKQRPL